MIALQNTAKCALMLLILPVLIVALAMVGAVRRFLLS